MKTAIANLIILTLLVIVTKIKIYIKYFRTGEDDSLRVTVEVFKYLRHTFVISLFDISKSDKEYGIKLGTSFLKRKKPKDSDEKSQFIDFKTILNRIKKLKRYYDQYWHTFRNIIKYLKKNTYFNKIDLYIEAGLDDPALTALSIGALWGGVSSVYYPMISNLRIKEQRLNILPNFSKQIIKINFNCIFAIRMGNIIYVGLRVLCLLILHKIQSLTKPKMNININN